MISDKASELQSSEGQRLKEEKGQRREGPVKCEWMPTEGLGPGIQLLPLTKQKMRFYVRRMIQIQTIYI
jgi:hypothetical protein